MVQIIWLNVLLFGLSARLSVFAPSDLIVAILFPDTRNYFGEYTVVITDRNDVITKEI